MAHGNDKGEPTLTHIIDLMREVIAGKRSREEVADWANALIHPYATDIEDSDVYALLSIVGMMDVLDSPKDYLYCEDDFRDWIEKFEKKAQSKTSNAIIKRARP